MSLPEPVNRVPSRVRAIYDCDADDDDELTFVVGEYITITGQPAKIQQFEQQPLLKAKKKKAGFMAISNPSLIVLVFCRKYSWRYLIIEAELFF